MCKQGTGLHQDLPGCEKQVESLQVRIKERANMGDTVVCGYYGPPEQGEEGNEAFGR